MRTSLFFIFFLAVVGLFGPTTASAATTEAIKNFAVRIDVHTDRSADIVETITYDFGDTPRHGIYRTIPLGFRAHGEPKHITIKMSAVTDNEGFTHPYTISSRDPWNLIIGSETETITGVHVYVIRYTVSNIVGFFEEYDELYWNITGTEWGVPIQYASAEIYLPPSVSMIESGLSAYCGRSGAANSCGAFSNVDGGGLLWQSGSGFYLAPLEGVTIALPFSKGGVVAPGSGSMFLGFLQRFWSIPFPFIFAFLFIRKRISFLLRRRKYYQANPIIAEYEASGISALEAGLIVNKKLFPQDMAAGIVSLAIMGYITITYSKGQFCFKKNKPVDETVPDELVPLLNVIENKCEKDFSLPYVKAVSRVIAETQERLLVRGFAIKGQKVGAENRLTSIVFPLFMAIMPGFFIWAMFGKSIGVIFSGTFVLIALLNLCMRPLSVYLTSGGLNLEHKLRGLKLYLQVAEADRINFHNAPAKTPELFEKLLPYAMVFGLEKKWAKEFESLYKIPPTWYKGDVVNGFSVTTLTETFGSLKVTTSEVMAASVPSSRSSWGSSSSSGSSGGGFSGGGGGGGGGGSW